MPRITIRPFCVCQREGGEGGERRRECVLRECIVRGREEREVRGEGGERRRECVLCECIVRGTHMDQC